MKLRESGEIRCEETAVTPVVGVVLMLALTVTMVAVAAPLVLTGTDRVGDEQPDVDLAFAYTEDVDADETDVFGATGDPSGVDADGHLTVIVESGESVPAEQLNVTGASSSGNLAADAGRFGADDDVSSGARLAVWASRGETVRVIWTAPDGDESAILDEFTVRPTP